MPTTPSIAATEARLMIETTLRATSEKLKPGALQHARRPAQLVGAEAEKKRSIVARPPGVRRSPRAASGPPGG